MIVTIDGPAGAGKSSVAKLLAERLGFEFLDTGAMFRAVTLAAVRAGIPLGDRQAVAGLLDTLKVELPRGKVLLNGDDVSQQIRAAEITAAAASIATNPAVRTKLAQWQRAIAQGRDFVCEGRDQGTIVFPDALCKFFLSADAEERARRRQREMSARGEKASFEEVLHAQKTRDNWDAARDIAPMVPAADAVQIDSTPLSLEQVVTRMETEVRARIAKQPAAGAR